jgi:MFS family permease
MRHYHNNARWLMWFAPFRVLSISAAYLVPFFLEKGLNQSQIFLLQSIFSVSYLLWEIPSGWLADRIGRARSIQLSVPFAVVGMVAYGFSDYWWQFVVCELLLAVANGLISGADKALLIDSLKAAGRGSEFVRIQQRIDALGYAAIAFGVPLSFVLVKYWGYGAAIVADGLVVGLGG